MNGLHYAVLVGINRYPGISDLRGARRDAESFREWLVDPEGGALPEENVKLVGATLDDAQVLDPFEALPTQREVNRALYQVNKAVKAKTRAQPTSWLRSRLYFFLAGHGIAPQRGEAAVLMADASKEMLGCNIGLSLYAEWYQLCSVFREIVFFADCCRSRMSLAPPFPPPFTECGTKPEKVASVIGFATSLGQAAYEQEDAEADPDGARGYFSKALIEGLRGGAADERGEISSNTLAQYVRLLVQDMTKNRVSPQDAAMNADPALPVVFRPAAQDLTRPTRSVRLRFPPGYIEPVQLLDGSYGKLDNWDPADGDWEMQLIDGLYRVASIVGSAPSPFRNNGLFEVFGGDVDVQL